MASLNLIVLCPNGRRQLVKVTPNTSVLEVLEEACKKQGFNPVDYDIIHYNRTVDLSLSVRFANLPNNALVELTPTKKIRKESTVTVAVQLESGERLVDNFSPSTSVWDVIHQCLSKRGESLQPGTSSAEPVCIYMRQQLTGEKIKQTTLRSLGLTSGNAIIRLLYREPEEHKQQAHISVPLQKVSHVNENFSDFSSKTDSWDDSSSHFVSSDQNLETFAGNKSEVIDHNFSQLPSYENKPSATDVSLFKSNVQENDSSVVNTSTFSDYEPKLELNQCHEFVDNLNDAKCEEMEIDDTQQNLEEPVGEIKYLGVRNAVLFNLDDITEVKKVDFPEEFYELTVSDVYYLMEEYRKQRNDLENEPLMLSSQKQAKMLEQLAQYRQTVIRIYFPDRLVLQGTFLVEESVQSVKDFVKDFLENESLDFYLYVTPPKVILEPEKTLLEARLLPAAVVYFGCNTYCTCYLKPSVRNQISDPRAAKYAAAESRKKIKPEEMSVQQIPTVSENMVSSNTNTTEVLASSVSSSTRNVHQNSCSGKVPKWLKLSKT